jgi:hypothetical protein
MPSPPVSLLIRLMLAHLLGDYWFQSDQVARTKHEPRGLLIHGLWHLALLVVLVALPEASNPSLWLVALGVTVVHVLIDAGTARIQPRDTRSLLLDQSLHAVTLLGAVALARPVEARALVNAATALLHQPKLWTFLTGFVATVWAGAVFVGRWVEPFATALAARLGTPRPGLDRAGRFIGLAERTLIFIAIQLRAEALIGFIIAAKAILRLPEARDAGTRELSEYYLAGSFASLAWAIGLSVLTRWAIQGRP